MFSVDKLPPLSTKLNLTATLEDVTVRLCDSDNSLAQIQISGSSLYKWMLMLMLEDVIKAFEQHWDIQEDSFWSNNSFEGQHHMICR